MKRYFCIKTPDRETPGYLWWLSDSEHGAWSSFFTYPSKNRELNSFSLPLADAIRAYEGIGYKCVEVELTIKQEPTE